MKKQILSIALAIGAVSASAFKTMDDDLDGHDVGRFSSNQWKLIDISRQYVDWECVSGGTACTGTLKSGATADANGYFSDAEVNFSYVNSHFEDYTAPTTFKNN